MREIQLKEAKARLSAVVDDALRGEEFVITRHGHKQAVVVSWETWRRLSNVPSFGRLLAAAPSTTRTSSSETRRRSATRIFDLPRRHQCRLARAHEGRATHSADRTSQIAGAFLPQLRFMEFTQVEFAILSMELRGGLKPGR